mgnify:CR=1 FL=1
MSLKENTLRCYFINKNDSPYFESPVFKKILKYIQTETNKAALKQVVKNFLLLVKDINGMQQMHVFLQHMHDVVMNKTVEQ